MSIRIDAVCKAYKSGGPHAVNDVTLEVRDGEFMVLVGPSGCGKSTLLKLIAGIEEVSGGRIFIGDRDVTDLDPRKRDIAMVFQSYALYPHLSVRGNLGFGLKLRKTSKAEMAARWTTSRDPRPRGADGPQAGRALRRPAPACGHGPRDRARAAGVPDGRAAVEPRREAARLDAGAALAPARAARRDDRLRHPRSGRGDDARPARGGACAAACCSSATRPSSSSTTPRTCSWPRSSAHPR